MQSLRWIWIWTVAKRVPISLLLKKSRDFLKWGQELGFDCPSSKQKKWKCFKKTKQNTAPLTMSFWLLFSLMLPWMVLSSGTPLSHCAALLCQNFVSKAFISMVFFFFFLWLMLGTSTQGHAHTHATLDKNLTANLRKTAHKMLTCTNILYFKMKYTYNRCFARTLKKTGKL